MISKKMQEAINAQINAELWSAYLYLSMSMDAADKGFKGSAHWFVHQFKEEQGHAEKLAGYLQSQNAKVVLAPIAAVQTEWPSVVAMFEDTLAHEQKVTAMIHDLCKLAAAEQDFERRTCCNGSSTSRSRRKIRPAASSKASKPSKARRWASTCSTRNSAHAKRAVERFH